MTHNLTVDVKHSVESFYPGLSSDEVELLSKNIVDNWDYSHIYTTMLDLMFLSALLSDAVFDVKTTARFGPSHL